MWILGLKGLKSLFSHEDEHLSKTSTYGGPCLSLLPSVDFL